jgi:hypothetical protein
MEQILIDRVVAIGPDQPAIIHDRLVSVQGRLAIIASQLKKKI